MLKIVHVADIHFGRLFYGYPDIICKKLLEHQYKAFKYVIDFCIENEVDMLIVAGDLFDKDRCDVNAMDFIKREFLRLKKVNIPIYLVTGNHDYFINKETFSGYGVTFLSKDRVEYIETEKYLISGYSYSDRFNSGVDYLENNLSDKYNIGVFHSVVTDSNKKVKYMPISLSTFQKAGYDYVAVGHIHRRLNISEYPYIEYPGPISILDKKQLYKNVHGFLYCELEKGRNHVEFIKTPELDIKRFNIDVSDDTFDEIRESIVNLLNSASPSALIFEGKLNASNKRILSDDIRINNQNHIIFDRTVFNEKNSNLSLNVVYKKSIDLLENDFKDRVCYENFIFQHHIEIRHYFNNNKDKIIKILKELYHE